MNKDIIRAHNEVMMVIGVAEPENAATDNQSEVARRRYLYEERLGTRLLTFGGIAEAIGIWGINGLRHPLLVRSDHILIPVSPLLTVCQIYKQRAKTPFWNLFQYHRTKRSLATFFFSGLPSFVLSVAGDVLIDPQARPTW
jgi:hypothetical protein